MLEADAPALAPQNLDAERQTLSACLMDNETLDDVMLVLRRDDFHRDAHELLWSVMTDLRTSGVPVDCVSVAEEMERRGVFGRFGGDDALTDVANAAPHSANALFHASVVRQKAQTRRLQVALAESLADIRRNMLTPTQLIDAAEARIFAIRDNALEGSTTGADALVGETLAAIELRRQGASQGLSTGFQALDAFVSLRPGELIILAARPSIGKTALAAAVAEHVAIRESVQVLFVSLEMENQALMERMLSSRAGVGGGKLRHAHRLSDGDVRAMYAAGDVVSRGLIEFSNAPRQGLGQIAAMGRRMKHRAGLGLVVIDYLGLIEAAGGRSKTRQDDVAEISRGLKAAARELKVPFLVLCQLNRQSESREDRRPRLADLRESGQIEQDADAVLLLHRPEFYDPADQPGVAEVGVAKNRNGATGATKLRFIKECTRFEDFPPGWDADAPRF